MSVKTTEPGVFEKSFRRVHIAAKYEVRNAVEVIVRIRRAAFVAQFKRMQQSKGGK